ncbi:MAG: sugar nucleotide-binding protein [Cellvibrionales bacterium]|nr:sugar nucleotide-binding protein [Cellvibrionales bacterium]
MAAHKILLIGFGALNQQLARLLRERGGDLLAVRRSGGRAAGVDLRALDATDWESLARLLRDERPAQAVITLTPDERSAAGYRRCYLQAARALVAAAADAGQRPAVLFVSSTSVYAQNRGELVNESSACRPRRFNGQVLLEAEQCLLNSELPTSAVRFSGIYGPGRHWLIEQSLRDAPAANSMQWTNRIHIDDCARVLAHLLAMPVARRRSIYVASDSEPVLRGEVQNWIRARFGLPAIDMAQAGEVSGKRCDNRRLLESGFVFEYPSYREGLVGVIEGYKYVQRRSEPSHSFK